LKNLHHFWSHWDNMLWKSPEIVVCKPSYNKIQLLILKWCTFLVSCVTENKHLFEQTRSDIALLALRHSFQRVLALGRAIYMQLLA
jgi:hypothetical protein